MTRYTKVDGVLKEITGDELAQFEAHIEENKVEDAATQYARFRSVAYPTIEEQLDMQYHDKINGTTTWADAIQAVKDEYPKPE